MPFCFEDQMLDLSRRELSRGGRAVTVEPRVFDLLVYLIENRDRLITKDELVAHIWKGRIVSDSAVTSAIAAARKAVGDNAQDQRLIQTHSRRGFRFIGNVGRADKATVAPRRLDFALPVTHYARSGEVSIAYQAMGTGPLDLVLVPGVISHVEYLHQMPGYTDTLRRMAAFARVITLDGRGQGLSDHMLDAPPLDQRMDDVRAVMDAVGSTRAALLGFSAGTATGALFAATYPDRVSHLILWGGIAKGLGRSPEEMERYFSRRLRDWGNGDFVKLAVSAGQPVSAELMERFGRLERLAASPGAFKAMMALNNSIDATPVLAAIKAPTMIMRNLGDALVPPQATQPFIDLMPTATLIDYPAGDHGFWTGDAAALAGDIKQFITGQASDMADNGDLVLATVVSTNMVLPADAAGVRRQRFYDAHGQLGRQIVRRHRGRLVKIMDHGLVATFDGPGRAVRCGLELAAAVKQIGAELQVGLHAGEIDMLDRDLAGSSFCVAAGIMHRASPGEVLASRVVADLAAGTGVKFSERRGAQVDDLPGSQTLCIASF